MNVRRGAGGVIGVVAEMRGRRDMPVAEVMRDLLLLVARATAPREVDAMFSPIEAIFGMLSRKKIGDS